MTLGLGIIFILNTIVILYLIFASNLLNKELNKINMKKQYQHKITSAIATLEEPNNSYYVILDNISRGYWDRRFIENCNDWEEVCNKCYKPIKEGENIRTTYKDCICNEKINKDYEILSFICIVQKGIYEEETIVIKNSSKKFNYWSEDIMLSLDHYKIHSVKRLSDGEIFTISDTVKYNGSRTFIIGSLIIDKFNNNIIASEHGLTQDSTEWCDISKTDFIKVKRSKLFTTTDNVDIYEGDNWYRVYNDNNNRKDNFAYQNWSPYFTFLTSINERNSILDLENKSMYRFSTKEAAENYIIENKPCLSIKDIENQLKISRHKLHIKSFKEFLIEIVKDKL